VHHQTEDLTRAEVAEILRVHPTTVARWAEEGALPHWKTPGGQLRFRREDIEAIRQPRFKTVTDDDDSGEPATCEAS